MGKRSRKQRDPGARAAAAAAPEPPPQPPPPSRRAPAAGRRPTEERPLAPWHPVPLVELCVLVGIVLMVIGFFSLGGGRGGILIACGMALASLAGLDTVVREHFAGFRSHSALLAGVTAVPVAGALYFARAPWIALVVCAAAVFVAAIVGFRRAFRRRSGGLSFR